MQGFLSLGQKLTLALFLALVLMVNTGDGVVSRVWATTNCADISCDKNALSSTDYLDCNKSKQNCWEESIRQAQSNAATLKNAIGILNGQISLQQLQVDQTLSEIRDLEEEIDGLTDVISGLSMSLDRMTSVLIERIRAQYKQSRQASEFSFIFSGTFNDLIGKLKYFSITQQQTAQTMQMTESRRLLFDEQKQLKEKKQQQLAEKRAKLVKQQQQLQRQKGEQQFLLTQTQNDEARYQKELATTLGEIQAIQSILAGKGEESKVRDVNQGDAIASIIVGASACSTGTHLHFEVVKNGANYNPADFLKSADVVWNNEPDGSFGFSGSWDWPVNNPARITQGYGLTYYARVRRAYGGQPHTGIDILSKNSSDVTVKAVKAGSLFRGSIRCGGGYLRYVKVQHRDEPIATYYLHVNY
jgi:peptidoglycan hydrolase CwlO-like protein